MDEEGKRRIAQFRFGVIHDLIGDRKLNRGERKRLLMEKSSCTWEIPGSGRSFISASTILCWARRYEKGGRRIESLYPDARCDRGRPRVLDDETILSLVELKKQLKGASLPVVLREAKLRKILHPGDQGASRHHLPSVQTTGPDETGRSARGSQTIRGGAAQRHLAVRRHARPPDHLSRGKREKPICSPSSTT